MNDINISNAEYFDFASIPYGVTFPFVYWIVAGLGLCACIFFIWFLCIDRSNVSLACRNVVKNTRRTAITLLALISAVTGSILIGVYFNRNFFNVREIGIRSTTGHIQIMKEGFFDYGSGSPMQYLISDYERIVEGLQSDQDLNELLDFITFELSFTGTLTSASGGESLNFLGRGVVSDIDNEIAGYDIIRDGSALDPDNPYAVVLGEGLATQLRIQPEDYVTVLAVNRYGSFDILDAEVNGTLSTFSRQYGNVLLKTDMRFAQEIMGTDSVNRIIVYLKDTGDTEQAYTIIDDFLNDATYGADLELYHWFDLSEVYKPIVQLFSNIFSMVSTILFFLVIFLVLNTMSMSVFERISEFGTLRSIGLKRTSLYFMVINEGIVLGIIGSVVGFVLAHIIGRFITSLDIILPPPPTYNKPYSLYLIPPFDKETLMLSLITMFSVIGLSVVASSIPAFKALRLKIVDAIRHI